MELTRELEVYIEQNSENEPELLGYLRRETFQKTTQPHMISGYIQGRVLSMLSKIISPKLILEIGTFTGYATLCLTEGLTSEGKIITIDKNKETAYLAEKYFSLSGQASQIEFIQDNALSFLSNFSTDIDLVFLDADKENYSAYIDLLKPLLKPGSIILADNILWKGKVIENEIKDKKTQFIKDFNSKIKNDPSFEVIILPIRDGISIIRKK